MEKCSITESSHGKTRTRDQPSPLEFWLTETNLCAVEKVLPEFFTKEHWPRYFHFLKRNVKWHFDISASLRFLGVCPFFHPLLKSLNFLYISGFFKMCSWCSVVSSKDAYQMSD